MTSKPPSDDQRRDAILLKALRAPPEPRPKRDRDKPKNGEKPSSDNRRE